MSTKLSKETESSLGMVEFSAHTGTTKWGLEEGMAEGVLALHRQVVSDNAGVDVPVTG